MSVVARAAARRACPGRIGRRLRRRWTSRASAGRRRMPSRRARMAAGPSLVELGQDVSDDPGAMAVGRLGRARCLRFAERRDGFPIDDGEAAEGPREGLLDVRLGIADQLARRAPRPCCATSGSRPRRRSMNGVVATVLPTRRRSQRDGRVDELLELRPAVRLARGSPCRRRGPGSRR